MVMSLDSMWNLISLPVIVPDHQRESVFPQSASPVYCYRGGYETTDFLSEGVGYWIKDSIRRTLYFLGDSYGPDTISLERGWNLIGSTSYPLPVSAIGSIPGGVITTPFYRYDPSSRSYMTSDTLMPGVGYWIKVHDSAQLILSSGFSAPSTNILIEMVQGDEPPPPPDGIAFTRPNIPLVYALYQNYPNPFNPKTLIEYDLPEESEVTLKVYNTLGQEVVTLVSGKYPAGSYKLTWDATNLASGVYLYRLHAGEYVETRKVVLLR